MKVFIDSNIAMYTAGSEHPHKAPSTRILKHARAGKLTAFSSTEILQEILYRYTALGIPKIGWQVYDSVVALCADILPVTLTDMDRAKRLLETISGLSVRDAIHAAVAINHDIGCIASFDKGFDLIPGLERIASV